MVRIERHKGFTLFELLVTMAVAGIIVSFGVPGFISLVQNNRAATYSNDLVTALNLGRSEATRRGVPIALCSSTDGATCSGNNDWSSGWIVHRPSDGQVLRRWSAAGREPNVLTGTPSITFQARGSLSGGAAQLQVRVPDCKGTQGRNVAINGAGRISVIPVGCP